MTYKEFTVYVEQTVYEQWDTDSDGDPVRLNKDLTDSGDYAYWAVRLSDNVQTDNYDSLDELKQHIDDLARGKIQVKAA